VITYAIGDICSCEDIVRCKDAVKTNKWAVVMYVCMLYVERIYKVKCAIYTVYILYLLW
jgi:hypothetical protein